MPMMRRGPLDRYPPEWVLRQANAHQVSGSIEFHSAEPATFYLDDGHIYAAEPGVDLVESAVAERAIPDEGEARQQVVSLLAQVLGADGGWYYHDLLGQHPGRGSWVWETATLLMETRAKAHEATTLAAWADRTVAIHDTPASSITLGADAWSVVVSLAEQANASELRARLGWNPGRLLSALTEVEQLGVLDPEPAWGSRPEAAEVLPPAIAAMALSPADAMVTAAVNTAGHHTGPLAPPPRTDDLANHRNARRRKLPGRRPASS